MGFYYLKKGSEKVRIKSVFLKCAEQNVEEVKLRLLNFQEFRLSLLVEFHWDYPFVRTRGAFPLCVQDYTYTYSLPTPFAQHFINNLHKDMSTNITRSR